MSPEAPFDFPSRDETTPLDIAIARELARSIAQQAFTFEDHECRAWALTDFHVWCALAGEGPVLAFESDLKPDTDSASGEIAEVSEVQASPSTAHGLSEGSTKQSLQAAHQ